jgi:hypothetical protein
MQKPHRTGVKAVIHISQPILNVQGQMPELCYTNPMEEIVLSLQFYCSTETILEAKTNAKFTTTTPDKSYSCHDEIEEKWR